MVSALALGPRGRVQTTNFVVCGILVVVAAIGIEEATSSIWLSGMLVTFGLGLVASGVFPMDPMRGYPPGTGEGTPHEISRAHRLHDVAAFVVFGSMPVAAGIAAFTIDSAPWSVYSGLTALITAGFVVFGAAWESDPPPRRVGPARRDRDRLDLARRALLASRRLTLHHHRPASSSVSRRRLRSRQ